MGECLVVSGTQVVNPHRWLAIVEMIPSGDILRTRPSAVAAGKYNISLRIQRDSRPAAIWLVPSQPMVWGVAIRPAIVETLSA